MIIFFQKHKTLILIIQLAAILRLWNLDSMPPHLRNDEAALGYNAYSILKTGKDEHGQSLPIIFQSFGDWKMGGYIYLTIPFINFIGLNDLAVRLPSAFSGIISVYLIYEIVKLIFVSKRLATVSAFILAISPLNIVFSRGAWEVNLSLTLTLAAILFFLKAIYKKKTLLPLSALFFGLTFITSHTAKLSTPIFILILSFSYYRQLKKINTKLLLTAVIICLLFLVPVGLSVIEGKITRLTTLSIFSYQSGFPLILSIVNRWFSLYSASTLFINGDTNPQHGGPNTGPFLLFDIILLVLGTITLIKKGTNFQKFFIFFGLLLLTLPSALTIEKVNFERILPVFIPMVILISIGIDNFFVSFKEIKFKKIIWSIVIFFYLLNYTYFLDQYFIHGSKKNDAWQYGFKEIFEKLNNFKNKEIVVQQSLEQPYIFLLFYQIYDPQKYQSIVDKVFIPNKEGKDMGLISNIDNIKFLDIDWSKTLPKSKTIFVMPIFKLNQQSEFYSGYKVIDEVRDLNGFPLYKIIETL